MIVFCSLVEPSLDKDMIPQWMRYFSDCLFDRYVIWIHDNGRNAEARAWFEERLSFAGWEYSTVYGEFRNGVLQARLIQNLRDTLQPNDRMVTADSDEVHDLPAGLYRSIALEHDYACGQLVDRWGSSLHDAHPSIPLDAQYPNKGDLYNEARDFVGGSGPQWDFHVITSKVLFSKISLPLVCNGSHGFYPMDYPVPRYKVNEELVNMRFGENPAHLHHLDNVNVWHYTWRGTALDRLMTKSYHSLWVISSIVKFFGMLPDDPKVLKLRDQWHEIMLNERGWMPASWSEEKQHEYA